MIYRFLANVVVGLHLAFIIFAVVGGLLVGKWKRCAWLHIPAFLWAVFIELKGWICPLTPLENWLRARGGEVGYEVGFIEHYLSNGTVIKVEVLQMGREDVAFDVKPFTDSNFSLLAPDVHWFSS